MLISSVILFKRVILGQYFFLCSCKSFSNSAILLYSSLSNCLRRSPRRVDDLDIWDALSSGLCHLSALGYLVYYCLFGGFTVVCQEDMKITKEIAKVKETKAIPKGKETKEILKVKITKEIPKVRKQKQYQKQRKLKKYQK